MSHYQDSVSEFFQITGFRAHSNGWFKKFDDKPLIDALLRTNSRLFRPGGPDAPLELVLGILPSGASYMLMTRDQTSEFMRKHDLEKPTRKPWLASQFLSLSPIYFHTREELEKKIAKYKQRNRNKNRRDEEPEDNSPANRGYVKTGSEVVHYRGYFEQQRTLYRLLKKDIKPGKVGMNVPPWLDGVRVVSLVFGVWAADNRVREIRLNDPILVDVGWTETSYPSFFELLAGSTVHLTLRSSKFLNRNSKTPSFSEVCEDDQAGLYSKLRSLLQSEDPVILLVHDEDMARRFLSRADIDVDAWSSGLSNLLAPAPIRTPYRSQQHAPNPSNAVPKCNIIDIQKLVQAVMATSYPGRNVPESAKVLHMQKDTRVCPGDDSLLQLRMWLSMAEGLAIDEQYTVRESLQPRSQVLGPPEQEGPQQAAVDANQDDMDPNDTVPLVQRSIAPIDFSDDDDDW